RSPTAEGVFRKLLAEEGEGLNVEVDSAGTHGFHAGSPPDERALRAAARRGFDLSRLRARQVTREDFDRFDLILAMDEENLSMLARLCPAERAECVRLFLEYGSLGARNVPDPYYGGENGFEHVLDLIEDAARGLLRELRSMPSRD